MHVAAQAGHPDTALVFLRRGVPMHMPNKVCVCQKLLTRDIVVIDVEAYLFQDGAVCLHAAARKGHVGVVKALLSKGALVDTKTKVVYSAFFRPIGSKKQYLRCEKNWMKKFQKKCTHWSTRLLVPKWQVDRIEQIFSEVK